MKPQACVLKTDGTNCDIETAYAFTKAGADATIVSVNALKSQKYCLQNFQILIIPGGFSYGDDVASGTIFTIELLSYFQDQLQQFIEQEKLIIGICNGFQVLVRSGLLPSRKFYKPQATLAWNNSGHFECRWVTMVIQKSPCIFTKGYEGKEITLPVAHAEGKYFTHTSQLNTIENNNLAVLRYSYKGIPTDCYPYNPNGALNSIAGICDTTGRIFGLMPHPERFIEPYHYPNWRREIVEAYGLSIFKNAVQYTS